MAAAEADASSSCAEEAAALAAAMAAAAIADALATLETISIPEAAAVEVDVTTDLRPHSDAAERLCMPTPALTVEPSVGFDGVARYAMVMPAGAEGEPPRAPLTSRSRRYREWHALRASLPAALLAQVEARGTFPPKRLHVPTLSCMCADELVEERAQGLTAWARELVAVSGTTSLPAVRAFFAEKA